MSNIFTAAFDAINDTLGNQGASAELRYATGTLTVLFASGVEGLKGQDETGRIVMQTANARYKFINEPANPIKEGDIVTITPEGAPEHEMRVAGRFDSAGLVRLSLFAEFG